MPKLNPLRRVPLFMVMQAAMVAREHWSELDPGERTRLQALIRKSRGRPNNLSAKERTELKDIVKHLDLIGAGRKVALGGRGRRRR
jgi:hypothetical protein